MRSARSFCLLRCFLAALLFLCGSFTEGADENAMPFQIEHDGLLRYTKSSASIRGIGDSVIRHDDFEITVDGQFQMIGSSHLIKEPGNGRTKRFRTEPVCISIVAIGKVRLKFAGTDKTFTGGTAVYRLSERSWTMDGVRLKTGAEK